MTKSLQGESIFRTHFICWRILGFLPTEKYRHVYIAYSIFMNIIVTIGYPLHLMIGLFKSTTMSDIIKNLAINLTCLVCSIKTLAIWLKFRNIENMFEIIRRQDRRICLARDEAYYYKNVVFKNVRLVLNMFVILCIGASSFAELAVLLNGVMGTWSLMYPAYFPFDPFASTKLYTVAHIYQYVGVSFQILQNVLNDTFAAMHLALLSGQIHALSLRVAKLGTDVKKTKVDNNLELLKCIQDHKDLLLYRSKLEDVISFYMFLQILVTSINLCASIVFVILFTTDLFTIVYYFIYFLSMTAEILPVCYYGTLMENEFQNLTNALFSANWIDQDDIFKKNIRIFIETTKKPLYIMAWLFRINLNSFIIVCKNSYSLFALIMNMKFSKFWPIALEVARYLPGRSLVYTTSTYEATRNNMTTNLQIETIFRAHFICWRILGFLPTEKYRQLYIAYSIFMNIIVTIGYPLHLMIGLFQTNTMSDIIKNLTINLTCLVCSIKTLAIWLKFHNIENIFDIIRRQDRRICLAKDEERYYKNVVFKKVRLVLNMFVMLCIGASMFAELSVLINGLMGTWRLLYPAYFPFDPFASTELYTVAHIYQYVGVSFQILQNALNDTFAAMHLALLSGQIHVLSMRVAKLGKKTKLQNNLELLKCVQDHKDLLLYRSKLEQVISFYMFLQILVTSINLCAAIVIVILFTTDLFTILYYCIYFLSMTAEIFPVCYYGSIMEIEFQNLTNALFSANWIDQDDVFKKNLRIFIEITKKPLYVTAWLFRINLNSFLVVCKNSYSLFALIMNIK
ncbi:uncharacterized protein LOC135953713 [Calliphora vicina]|uniref:uncharacterized protein LOC135953713 n=1 Tax=Calliphora vicina TaxID=7373 RepID=UPI00325AE1B4